MNDVNSTALAALAAALAPYLAQHMGGAATQGNPSTQAGGTFGNPQTGGAINAGFGAGVQNTSTGPQTTQAAGGMFGMPQVTPDMIQTLITPLVQNEQIKAALTAQMQAMGINNLTDATPAQLPEMYQRFKNVEDQARAAGLLGGAGGGSPSII